MRLRNPRGLDPTLSDILRQALREGRRVELVEGEHGLGIAVDGQQFVDGLAWESYDYPLHGGNWDEGERELIDELLRGRARWQAARSKERTDASAHAVVEGYDGD